MRGFSLTLTRIVFSVLTVFLWAYTAGRQYPGPTNAAIIVGAVLLVYPVVGLGRMVLDRGPTPSRLVWTTTLVHFALLLLLGEAILKAAQTHRQWYGVMIPVPRVISLPLLLLASAAALLTVFNLAWKGLGAPIAVAMTRRLATGWLYAWTRNPMVLATLSGLFLLGIYYQSGLFVLWVLAVVTPAWLGFLKIYEERELEIRFGSSYLEYRRRTPILIPRKP